MTVAPTSFFLSFPDKPRMENWEIGGVDFPKNKSGATRSDKQEFDPGTHPSVRKEASHI